MRGCLLHQWLLVCGEAKAERVFNDTRSLKATGGPPTLGGARGGCTLQFGWEGEDM